MSPAASLTSFLGSSQGGSSELDTKWGVGEEVGTTLVPASFRLSGSVGLLPVLFIAFEFRKSLSETSSPTSRPEII